MAADSSQLEFPIALASNDGISSVRFSPYAANQNLLAATSWDSSLCIYDTELLQNLFSYQHAAAMLTCCFGKTANEVFCAGLSRSIKRYDLASSESSGSEVGQHEAAVRCLGFSAATGLLVSGSWDKTIKLWDVKSNSPTCASTVKLPDKVFAMEVFGHQVIAATAGKHVRLVDLRKPDQPVSTSVDCPLKFQIRTIKAFPDETRFAVGSIEGRVGVESFQSETESGSSSKKSKFTFKCHRKNDPLTSTSKIYPVNTLCFHKQFGTFATGGGDGSVVIWDANNRKKVSSIGKYNTSIADMDFNQGGTKLAIAASYTFEEGELGSTPKDELIIRKIREKDVKPKTKS